jgi:glycosyltransferase involved in cell wall biosynthesis
MSSGAASMDCARTSQRPLRVVYAIDNLGCGGAQRQVAELAVHLGRAPDVEASVVMYRAEDFYDEKLLAAGVRIDRVPRRSVRDPAFPFRLARRLDSLAPDVIHAFLLHPALWTSLALRAIPRARRPLLIAAERSSLVATSRSLWLRQLLVYRTCDAITVNAQPVGAEIEDKLGVDPAHIRYLPNGIDLEEWTKAAALPPPWPIDRGQFHLALVGSHRPVKNHALVLAALERLGTDRIRDWRVWFVGDPHECQAFADSLRQSLESRRLAEIVRFTAATPRIAALVARMDGVLLPSLYEGFPNVVLEAMALGVPVLASRVGDVPNLIDDGSTGFLLPRLDVEAMAEGLLRLHSLTPEERRAMGGRARDRVASRFTMDRIADRHVALYRELLAARGRSGNRTGSG